MRRRRVQQAQVGLRVLDAPVLQASAGRLREPQQAAPFERVLVRRVGPDAQASRQLRLEPTAHEFDIGGGGGEHLAGQSVAGRG